MPAVSTAPDSLDRDRQAGVGWMNRGHELMLRGDGASLAAALVAYNEAIACLRPPRTIPDAPRSNSLGAALMNRGHLLHRLHGVDQAAVALQSFDEAAAVLRPLAAGENPWPRRNLTGTLVNRANLLLDLVQFPAAAGAARDALQLAGPHERTHVVDADLALKARRALADALGQQLVTPGADQAALANEASDVVDEALALVRHWRRGQEFPFPSLTLRFFRYGLQLYRFHQPHFLPEFIQENLAAPTPEFRALALEAIDATLADRPADGTFLTIGDPQSERRRQAWNELAALRARLAA